jgi:asparagine synthase (glutamine-hydrolysing)
MTKLYNSINLSVKLYLSIYEHHKYNGKDYFIIGNPDNIPFRMFLKEDYNELEIGWGLVIADENELVIVSDKLRTFPLFYKITNNTIQVTDNCNLIITDEDIIDEYASFEYRSAGFVRGNRTLFRDIFQTEAGSIVKINIINTNTINLQNYYTYLKNDENTIHPNLLLSELQFITQKTIEEIRLKCANRRIIIPLSSGLDSRFVAYLAKKTGIKDILCFTYGKGKFIEVKKAKEIAKKIDIKWVHVPYSRKIWKKASHNPLFKNYLYNDSWIGSLAHIQDWPAILWLIENNYIHKDTIIMPGHTGDFISGGHIVTLLQKKESTIDELLSAIIEKHFRVNRPTKNSENTRRLKKELTTKILESEVGGKDPYFCTKYIEHFDWKERQTKFIVNSIQVYKSFNLEWHLPLWSNYQFDFWSRVPIEHKFNKKLYIEYLKSINEYGLFEDLKTKNGESIQHNRITILKLIKRFLLLNLIAFRKQYLDYYFDNYGWYTIFPYFKVIGKFKFQNINSFLVDKVIEENDYKRY